MQSGASVPRRFARLLPSGRTTSDPAAPLALDRTFRTATLPTCAVDVRYGRLAFSIRTTSATATTMIAAPTSVTGVTTSSRIAKPSTIATTGFT
jgi:hypothetical protein